MAALFSGKMVQAGKPCIPTDAEAGAFGAGTTGFLGAGAASSSSEDESSDETVGATGFLGVGADGLTSADAGTLAGGASLSLSLSLSVPVGKAALWLLYCWHSARGNIKCW